MLKKPNQKVSTLVDPNDHANYIYMPDLVREISQRTGRSALNVRPVVKAVFDSLKYNLFLGKKILIVKFCVFELRDIAPSINFAPKTGEKTFKPKRKKPKVRFSPGFISQIEKITTERDRDGEGGL